MNTSGLGPATLVLLPSLIAVAAMLSALGRLGHTRGIPLAVMRAIVQLGVVGLVVGFALFSYVGTAAFLALMSVIATGTSGRRLRGLPHSYLFAGLAICVPSLIVLSLLLVTRSVPLNPATMLPLGGILIGGAMSATSVAGKRIRDSLASGRGQYEAALALGFGNRFAVRLVVGRNAADALIPALDQTRTVGLVTLPGTFVGMVLGGSSPWQAAAFQLVVLVCLLVVETASILLITELVALRPPDTTPS